MYKDFMPTKHQRYIFLSKMYTNPFPDIVILFQYWPSLYGCRMTLEATQNS